MNEYSTMQPGVPWCDCWSQTTEPIEMPFAVWIRVAKGTICMRLGPGSPRGKAIKGGGHPRFIVKYRKYAARASFIR